MPTFPRKEAHEKPPSIMLSASGLQARIVPDGFLPEGYILEIGGAAQSHVDLADPKHLVYEYLGRIANLVDVLAPAAQPIRVLHLGIGALTLARYIQACRPGSVQVGVDIERELASFVQRYLPLHPASKLTFICQDAAQAISQLPPDLLEQGGIDLIVVDIFSGSDAPEHLSRPEFYTQLKGLLAAEGMLAINIGDDPSLRFFAQQSRHMLAVFEQVWCLCPQAMLTGTQEGNLILAGSSRPMTENIRQELLTAGPHPAAVLDTYELANLEFIPKS